MRIIADTNLLLRAITGDDPVQSPIAQAELARAETIAIPLVVQCERAWVLAWAIAAPRPRSPTQSEV